MSPEPDSLEKIVDEMRKLPQSYMRSGIDVHRFAARIEALIPSKAEREEVDKLREGWTEAEWNRRQPYLDPEDVETLRDIEAAMVAYGSIDPSSIRDTLRAIIEKVERGGKSK